MELEVQMRLEGPERLCKGLSFILGHWELCVRRVSWKACSLVAENGCGRRQVRDWEQ